MTTTQTTTATRPCSCGKGTVTRGRWASTTTCSRDCEGVQPCEQRGQGTCGGPSNGQRCWAHR